MEHLHEKLCWMLENNQESFLRYDHKRKEYTIYLVGILKPLQFKGVVSEDCTIGFNGGKYSIHDIETKEVLCKVSGTHISTFAKMYVTEGMMVDSVNELPKKLCGILEHNPYTTLRFDHVSQRYIIFFQINGKKRYLPKGYIVDYPNRRIIHEETGKLLCGYQHRL